MVLFQECIEESSLKAKLWLERGLEVSAWKKKKKKYFADCFSLTNRHFRYIASVLELDHRKEIPVNIPYIDILHRSSQL